MVRDPSQRTPRADIWQYPSPAPHLSSQELGAFDPLHFSLISDPQLLRTYFLLSLIFAGEWGVGHQYPPWRGLCCLVLALSGNWNHLRMGFRLHQCAGHPPPGGPFLGPPCKSTQLGDDVCIHSTIILASLGCARH